MKNKLEDFVKLLDVCGVVTRDYCISYTDNGYTNVSFSLAAEHMETFYILEPNTYHMEYDSNGETVCTFNVLIGSHNSYFDYIFNKRIEDWSKELKEYHWNKYNTQFNDEVEELLNN